jgi:hypothetical protein
MARRAPASVRADQYRRRLPGERIPVAQGISARGLAEVARLERTKLWPGAIFHALQGWARFTRASDARRQEILGCGEPACCPDPLDNRKLLDRVVAILPPSDARLLRRRIEEMDSRIYDWREISRPWS